MSLYLETFFNKWFHPALPNLRVDLTGRTVIVTGSNVGLGFEAAKSFYAMNPKTLILAVRSVSKGEEAKKILTGENSSRDTSVTKVEVWPLDLASFDSVKVFATKANKELNRLDILLENAGVGESPYTLTNDRWETSTQTNVISTFMLAALLFPLVAKTAKSPAPVGGVRFKPHISFVTSDMHTFAKFQHRFKPNVFKALSDKTMHNPTEQYSTTKLLEILLTRQMANSPIVKETAGNNDGSDIVICSINPGFARSELMRNMPIPDVVRMIMYALLARTTEEASRNLVWGSLSEEMPNGAYISSCQVTRPASYGRDPESFEMQERLWKELGEIVTPLAPETKDFWRV